MKYFIGVDGGGTKTAFCAVGTDGTLRHAVSGALNYNFIGQDAAFRSFDEGIRALGISADEIAAAAIGDPAIDDMVVSASAIGFAEGLQKRFCDAELYIRSDAYMALYACTGGAPGVIVISGTGAMALGVGTDGIIRAAGGWGRLTGDEGSGYYIALSGLRAAFACADGTGKETALRSRICDRFGVRDPRELTGILYGEHPPDITPLSLVVAACADAGDEVSLNILRDAGGILADLALALCRRCGVSRRIGVSGSVLQKNPTVRGEFERRVSEAYPGIVITEPERTPEEAAAAYAAEEYAKRRKNNGGIVYDRK